MNCPECGKEVLSEDLESKNGSIGFSWGELNITSRCVYCDEVTIWALPIDEVRVLHHYNDE